jgi:hypothetical protein
MPAGLPQVSSTQEQCRLIAARAMEAWHDFVVYLDLSPASVYTTSCTTAWHDVRAAFRSTGYLGYLTFRPLVLILWLLLRYLWKVLQFLGRHLFHHAYVSAGKGWIQLKWGSKEFYKWQSSLSRAAVLIEISVVAALIGCYLLRRYIQRKKYVQRTTSWYRRKKHAVNGVSINVVKRRILHYSISPPFERGHQHGMCCVRPPYSTFRIRLVRHFFGGVVCLCLAVILAEAKKLA